MEVDVRIERTNQLVAWWRQTRFGIWLSQSTPQQRWMLSGICWLACCCFSLLFLSPRDALLVWAALLVHELAHLMVARDWDKPPIWIPGVGAILPYPPADVTTALAGAAACLPVAIGYSFFAPIPAAILCAFHLAALCPLPPLDGGWVMGSGWWSIIYVAIMIAMVGPIAIVLIPLFFIRIQAALERHRIGMLFWGLLVAAWLALAFWAPWL